MSTKQTKAMYLCENVDLFIPVADKLSKDYGVIPVFWSALLESQDKLKVAFPDAVLHDSFVEGLYATPEYLKQTLNFGYITPTLLKELSVYEHIFMEMLYTRADSGGGFNFYEAQAIYHDLIVQAFALLDYFQPDVLIFELTPHMIWDYVLYMIAKYRGLETLMLMDTPLPGRMIVYKNLLTGEFAEKKEPTRQDVPEKLQQYIDSIKGDFSSGTTYMIKSRLVNNRKEHHWSSNQIKKRLCLQRKKSTKLAYREHINKFLGRKGADVTRKHYLKESGKSWYESFQSALDFHTQRIKDTKKRKALLDRYTALSIEPDFTQPYVYFPLHWQPENTTVPMAGRFSDQYMAVKMLSEAIPENYQIYIKENPGQFEWHRASFARYATFYDDFTKVNGVKLVKMESDPFLLIDHSVCVYTITGTVGWEAVIRNKIALVTGQCIWYRGAPGTYNVDSVESIKDIFQKVITKDIYIDKNKLKEFICSLLDRTYECVVSSAHIERLVDDKEKNINEAAGAVVNHLFPRGCSVYE